MKQVSIRELQQNAELFNQLPLEITRYGKVIAHVIPPHVIPPTPDEEVVVLHTPISEPTPATELQIAYVLYEQEKKNIAQKTSDPEGKTEDEFVIPRKVGRCKYCKLTKEVNTVLYRYAEQPDEEIYLICDDDMKKLDSFIKEHGGTIVSVDGAELL